MRLLLGVLGMLVVFYAVPVNTQASPGRAAISVVLTLLGIAALAWAIVEQLRRQLHSRSEDIHTLVMLLVLVAMVFALGFFVLEEHSPGQVSGIATRTDALYFTMSTLTTVGYGDVHAEGQLARGLAIVQLVFNAVFVGALVSTVVGTIRSRAPRLGDGRKP
ncbi:MAG: potassium channel family protein [Marmoricola sp.]